MDVARVEHDQVPRGELDDFAIPNKFAFPVFDQADYVVIVGMRSERLDHAFVFATLSDARYRRDYAARTIQIAIFFCSSLGLSWALGQSSSTSHMHHRPNEELGLEGNCG